MSSSSPVSASERKASEKEHQRIVLVGSPNVGKSALFYALTQSYTNVSNYPGTTVEVARGRLKALEGDYEVLDTPGMYSFLPITEEENVARQVLLESRPSVVLHVVEAKNLERTLPLTLTLLEAGLPVILVLNMMDESEALGQQIDVGLLESRLGIPVQKTVVPTGQGIQELKERIFLSQSSPCSGCLRIMASFGSRENVCAAGIHPNRDLVRFSPGLEKGISKVTRALQGSYSVRKRALALLLLQGDQEIEQFLRDHEPSQGLTKLLAAKAEVGGLSHRHLRLEVSHARRETARRFVQGVIQEKGPARSGFASMVSGWCINPVSAIPILLAVLYLGIYQFVGVFGAGTMVDFIENEIFGRHINPVLGRWVNEFLPFWKIPQLLVGEYGIWTIGITYAVAIVLPVVGTFFLVFSILEDSGYLPRIALMVDRLFKKVGLNGRAVIPLLLGLGCVTTATIVTRTLETRRERIIATLLLGLTIPCSAQLGIVIAILSTAGPTAFFLYIGCIVSVFLLVGFLSARFMPGSPPSFFMELPPMRVPRMKNVLQKTFSRMKWYSKEILPLFILASVALWILDTSGGLNWILHSLTPLMGWLGFEPPKQIPLAQSFLFGFFRRDFGAAGLFMLSQEGSLDPALRLTTAQWVVSTVTITLFVPCLAQFMIMWKERGWKVAISMFVFITIFAFLTGAVLNLVLSGVFSL